MFSVENGDRIYKKRWNQENRKIKKKTKKNNIPSGWPPNTDKKKVKYENRNGTKRHQ